MAHAALISVINILENVLHSDCCLVPCDKPEVEYLLQKFTFLQEFLENYSQTRSDATESLESRIRDIAYEAEDMIESSISVPFCLRSEEIRSLEQEMQDMRQKIDCIIKEVMNLKDKYNVEDLQPREDSAPAVLSSSIASPGEKVMIGLYADLLKIKGWLTGPSKLNIISIVGAGGIGKTTLARTVYDDKLIMHHFYIRAWITVSQRYRIQDLLLGLLKSVTTVTDKMREESNEQLKEHLYKILKRNKYLIVLDDVWDTDVWDGLKRFFPDDDNGSRVLLTTRETKTGHYASSSSTLHHMSLLDDEESWYLLSRLIFGEGPCPCELEEHGRIIAKDCKGLPLTISVIAGLLSKNRNGVFWTYVAGNVRPLVNRHEDQCSKILWLSYNHLPHHLKACFLFMGVFPEDFRIRVSKLVRLWVAEGFLKPIRSKSLEETAMDYLKDLIDRNLVSLKRHGSNGKPRTCSIHDLLRDLILKETQKEKFLGHLSDYFEDGLQQLIDQHRLSCFLSDPWNTKFSVLNALDSMSSIRSFLCNFGFPSPQIINGFRKLRVLDASETLVSEEVLQLVQLRYLAFRMNRSILSGISMIRNLQTLEIQSDYYKVETCLPSEIWELPRLRHLIAFCYELPDPAFTQTNGESSLVLQDLRTLHVKGFRCTEEVCKRIPNLKRLKINYWMVTEDVGWPYYCLHNLVHLQKLESLTCEFATYAADKTFLLNVTFPLQLRKLSLRQGVIQWKDLTSVGSLPNLEVLKLKSNACIGPEWEPIEGEFRSVKFLLIETEELAHWTADNSHFPRLENLILLGCRVLEEIPIGIGDIPTLRSIELFRCSPAAEKSAKQIQEEQSDYGNNTLEVHIRPYRWA